MGCQKVPQKVPPRLRQVSPRFHQSFQSFVVSLVVWGRPVLGFHKFPRKVPARSRQSFPSSVVYLVLWGRSVVGSTKVSTRSVLGCQRFRGRFHHGSAKFHQGSTKFFKFCGFSGSLGHVRLGLPRFHQGSAEGSTKVSSRFHQNLHSVRGVSGFLEQMRLGLPKGCLEVSTKVPPRFRQGSTKVSGRFHQGFTMVAQIL